MATYKVPQDVEADDKLLGPFSFRQFIYLIIVALAIGIAWGLSRLFIGLAIIPLPVVIFFGALALPLRKDQPMEIYLAAMVSFYLKPRQRMWDPEGIETTIEITAPKTVEVQRTKDLSQTEAAQRLSYLADIVDSQGWAIRGVNNVTGTAMNSDVYLEAQGAEDVLDTNTAIAHSFDQMMLQSTERIREEAKQRMVQATVAPAPVAAPTSGYTVPAQFATPDPSVHYDPYPTFHQSIIQPLNDSAHMAESDIPQPVAQAPVAASAPAPATIPATPAPVQTSAPSTTAATPVALEAPEEEPWKGKKAEHHVFDASLSAVENSRIAQATVAAQQAAAQALENATHPQQTVVENTLVSAVAPASPLAAYTTPAPSSTNSNENGSDTSDAALTADIINLANNPDLSIETIAHEAERIHKKAKKKKESSDEVVISLR